MFTPLCRASARMVRASARGHFFNGRIEQREASRVRSRDRFAGSLPLILVRRDQVGDENPIDRHALDIAVNDFHVG